MTLHERARRVVRLLLRMTAGVMLAAAASPASAQGTSFGELAARLDKGDVVYVTDTAGARYAGTLLKADRGSIALEVKSTRREFPVDRVRRVETPGPTHRLAGALIGAGSGVVLGLILGRQGCDARATLCINDVRAPSAALFGALGAATGAGVGAAVHGKPLVLYQAPTPSAGVRWLVAPVFSRRGAGVRVDMAF